jgi:hypothetical protein
MLPDIRAVIAAVVAAVGLLMISFGLVAAFRVAQDNHSGALQADVAKRGHDPLPAGSDRRPVHIIETPAAKAVAAEPIAETPPATPVPAIEAAPPAATVATTPQNEPPLGGSLDERPAAQPERSRNTAAVSDEIEKSAAAEKARKARAARIARERRAAARRAARARRANEAKQQAAPFGGGQYGSFGGPFTTPRQ